MPPRGTDKPAPVGPVGPARPRPKPIRDAASFDFFFYGTLCDEDVRATVVGRRCAVEAATLDGHEAVPVERGRFPILLAQRGRAAAGVLCPDLSLGEAARLGLYEHEGRDYTARRLPVRTTAGQTRSAWVFVPLAAFGASVGAELLAHPLGGYAVLTATLAEDFHITHVTIQPETVSHADECCESPCTTERERAQARGRRLVAAAEHHPGR